MGFDGVKALINGARVFDENKGLGDDVGVATMSDVEIGLLAIFVSS